MEPGRIRHTVSFTLAHPAGSAEERDFLDAARRLGAIPGVEAFDVLSEVSPKHGFRYGVSLEVANQAAYDGYSAHADHVRCGGARWLKEIGDCLAIDCAARGLGCRRTTSARACERATTT